MVLDMSAENSADADERLLFLAWNLEFACRQARNFTSVQDFTVLRGVSRAGQHFAHPAGIENSTRRSSTATLPHVQMQISWITLPWGCW